MQKEYPNDWFDLTEQQLADLGAMFFLSSLVKKYNQYKVAELVQLIEPPLRLNQYKVLTSNGFPRAFFTWAGLSDENQAQFGLNDKYFGADQWASGTNIWLVDLVSPFGHATDIREIMVNQVYTGKDIGLDTIRARRERTNGKPARISQWHRDEDGQVKYRSFSKKQFQSEIGTV